MTRQTTKWTLWLAMVLLTSGCLVQQVVRGFVMHVKEYETVCFFENLQKGEKMGLNYQVEEGGDLDIDMEIRGPFRELIHNKERESMGSFSFSAEHAGRYTYCFNNEHTSRAEKTVIFNVFGSPNFDRLNPQPKSEEHSVTPLETEVRQLTNGLRAIRDDQQYMIVRERIHRNTAESTNSRVLWWSLFQATLLTGVCFWQVFYLKRFFEVKRVV